MNKCLVALLTVFLLDTSVYAADKIRISIPNLSGQFMTMPLAKKEVSLKKRELTLRLFASPVERPARQ